MAVIRFCKLVFVPALIGSLVALSACGGGDDDGGDATAAATTAPATTPAEVASPTATPEPTPVPTATPAPVPVTDVDIRFFAFNPGDVEIKVGESVKWTVGDDDVTHTVTADDGTFTSGELSTEPGTAYQISFDFPGEYAYHCEIHADMTGTVVVVEA